MAIQDSQGSGEESTSRPLPESDPALTTTEQKDATGGSGPTTVKKIVGPEQHR